MQKSDYSYFNDELALMEIRKHKWIESEKIGTEVGFATAAWDWITKYGQSWKLFRLAGTNTKSIFQERRQYRRFPKSLNLKLKVQGQELDCAAQDFSIVGFSCFLPFYVEENTPAELSIELPRNPSPNEPSDAIRFSSKIQKISSSEKNSSGYQAFLPFNEKVRNLFRSHPALFENISV